MSWIAVAVGGSAVLGAYSANRAMSAQTKGANQASAMQSYWGREGIKSQMDMYSRQKKDAYQDMIRQWGAGRDYRNMGRMGMKSMGLKNITPETSYDQKTGKALSMGQYSMGDDKYSWFGGSGQKREGYLFKTNPEGEGSWIKQTSAPAAIQSVMGKARKESGYIYGKYDPYTMAGKTDPSLYPAPYQQGKPRTSGLGREKKNLDSEEYMGGRFSGK